MKGLLAALFVIVLVIAAVSGGGDDGGGDTRADDAPPEKVDTGRMSDGEFDYAVTVLEQFESETDDFTEGMPRCATIASAGQLAESADCWDDAYDGLEGDAGYAYSVLEDLESDTRGRCRRTVIGLKKALDRYTTTMQAAHDLASNLRGDVQGARVISRRMPQDAIRYLEWSTRLYERCSPA